MPSEVGLSLSLLASTSDGHKRGLRTCHGIRHSSYVEVLSELS